MLRVEFCNPPEAFECKVADTLHLIQLKHTGIYGN